MRVYRRPINALHTWRDTPPAEGKAFLPLITVWQTSPRQHHNCCGVAEKTSSRPRCTLHSSTSPSFFTLSPLQPPPNSPPLLFARPSSWTSTSTTVGSQSSRPPPAWTCFVLPHLLLVGLQPACCPTSCVMLQHQSGKDILRTLGIYMATLSVQLSHMWQIEKFPETITRNSRIHMRNEKLIHMSHFSTARHPISLLPKLSYIRNEESGLVLLKQCVVRLSFRLGV